MQDTTGLRRGYPGMKPPNAGRRYPPEPLTRGEVLALLNACGRGPTGIRNRAIIAVLWRAGLRVAELVALLPARRRFRERRAARSPGQG